MTNGKPAPQEPDDATAVIAEESQRLTDEKTSLLRAAVTRRLKAQEPVADEDALIERVARAICEANGEECIQDGFPEWRKYKPDARAAIAELARLQAKAPETD